MTLLVATQNPNATAETYVRQHMSQIAPGQTVGLGLALRGAMPSELPFLSVEQPRNLLARKLYLLRGKWFHGFAGAPVGRQRKATIAFLRAHGVRLVLAEFGPTGAAMREICKSEGIPLLVNFHGYDATVMPKRRAIRAAYALLGRDAAGFLCGSEHFRETVAAAGIPIDRIAVIPCGVQTADFGASPQRTGNRLIAVGRLTPKKAPLMTLSAFTIARRKCPDLLLDIIGDGPLRAACESFVAENGLGDCVNILGACDHNYVRAALRKSDIFVQHSVLAPNGDTESQGISLVEAMASALPVVVTNHNGFSETVLHGETGFLVDEGDVQAMADYIVELAHNSSLRNAMGRAGEARARITFDESLITARLKEHFAAFWRF